MYMYMYIVTLSGFFLLDRSLKSFYHTFHQAVLYNLFTWENMNQKLKSFTMGIQDRVSDDALQAQAYCAIQDEVIDTN